MTFRRICVSLIVLFLLSAVNPAQSEDKVLVPGDAPLRQSLLDSYREYHEWLLDIQLTEPQRRQWEGVFIGEFQKKSPARRRAVVTSWQTDAPDRERLAKLIDTERDQQRAGRLNKTLDSLRKSADRDDRLLVDLYEAEHRRGGSKNPILAAGDPPLTQAMTDLDIAKVESLFALRLTGEQRREYRQLRIDQWKEWNQDQRQRSAKTLESWAELATWSNYRHSLSRVANLPGWLEMVRKGAGGKCDRWLLALYESAYKPGSARNPILVAGAPALTQFVVDRYCDYVDVMIDLSIGGGLTATNRGVLQDHLVKDWQKMEVSARKELLDDLQRMADAAAKGTAEAKECIAKQRAKVLAQLNSSRDSPRSRFLLESIKTELNLRHLLSELESMRHDTTMKIYDNILPSGHFEYKVNSSTGRPEYVWVP